jgi:hypothetical protein
VGSSEFSGGDPANLVLVRLGCLIAGWLLAGSELIAFLVCFWNCEELFRGLSWGVG